MEGEAPAEPPAASAAGTVARRNGSPARRRLGRLALQRDGPTPLRSCERTDSAPRGGYGGRVPRAGRWTAGSKRSPPRGIPSQVLTGYPYGAPCRDQRPSAAIVAPHADAGAAQSSAWPLGEPWCPTRPQPKLALRVPARSPRTAVPIHSAAAGPHRVHRLSRWDVDVDRHSLRSLARHAGRHNPDP